MIKETSVMSANDLLDSLGYTRNPLPDSKKSEILKDGMCVFIGKCDTVLDWLEATGQVEFINQRR